MQSQVHRCCYHWLSSTVIFLWWDDVYQFQVGKGGGLEDHSFLLSSSAILVVWIRVAAKLDEVTIFYRTDSICYSKLME